MAQSNSEVFDLIKVNRQNKFCAESPYVRYIKRKVFNRLMFFFDNFIRSLMVLMNILQHFGGFVTLFRTVEDMYIVTYNHFSVANLVSCHTDKD